jgi:hypothetical protein
MILAVLWAAAEALSFGVHVLADRDFCIRQMTVNRHRFSMHSTTEAGTYTFTATQDGVVLAQEKSQDGIVDSTEYSTNNSMIYFCWHTSEPQVTIVVKLIHSEEHGLT